jgi:hypothetical protein
LFAQYRSTIHEMINSFELLKTRGPWYESNVI